MPMTRVKQSGFTMIEVMVTVVIVAIGLLGLAALLLKGLQAGNTSQLRSLAVAQAYDMADRMRANSAGVAAGKYDNILPSGSASNCTTLLASAATSPANVGPPTSSPGTCTDCSSNSCSISDVAARDRCLWQKANAGLLPNGAGAICKNASKPWYTIYVSWDEGRSGTTDKTFSISFEP